MVRACRFVAALAVALTLTAVASAPAAAKETCEMEKMMLGFRPEPSRINVGATGASIEVYHEYQSPSTMKVSEYLTCRLHFDCTIAAGVASFALQVEETEYGVGSIKSKRKVVRAASAVEFQNSGGAVVQKCQINRITDK